MNRRDALNPLPFWKSCLLFCVPSVYFFGVSYLFIPYFTIKLKMHPALSWIAGGHLVFIPLFMLAFYLYRKEGRTWNLQAVLERFRIKKLSVRDWYWTIGATLAVLIATGVIMAGSAFLVSRFGFHELATTPLFMKFKPLQGYQRWYLGIWLPMFFFNIVGEEVLWRGYILPRQELRHGKWAWLVNSLLWLIFHACFGMDLMLVLLPTLLIIPFIVSKTENTTIGIIVHGMLNGPSFIMVALGLIR